MSLPVALKVIPNVKYVPVQTGPLLLFHGKSSSETDGAGPQRQSAKKRRNMTNVGLCACVVKLKFGRLILDSRCSLIKFGCPTQVEFCDFNCFIKSD